jgi:uncharacterized protein YndB with AHSA1/START domain
VLCVVGVLWYGYRKLETYAGTGPSTTITIDAPARRVFANIADADSMTEWRAEGLGIRASHRGPLKVRDTLHMQVSGASPERERRSTWVVTALVPAQLLAMDMLNDSGRVVATRRDSLIALGDSTKVVSTFAAPMLDSIRAAKPDSGGKMAGVAEKLLISGMKMQSSIELQRLKARLEGDTVPTSRRPPPR